MDPDSETPDAAATVTRACGTCPPASSAAVPPPSSRMTGSGDVSTRRSAGRDGNGRTDTYTGQGQIVFWVPRALVYR